MAGRDPFEYLKAIADKVVYVHAKDIALSEEKKRGEITGTPAGCACGDGVIDWPAIIDVLKVELPL